MRFWLKHSDSSKTNAVAKVLSLFLNLHLSGIPYGRRLRTFCIDKRKGNGPLRARVSYGFCIDVTLSGGCDLNASATVETFREAYEEVVLAIEASQSLFEPAEKVKFEKLLSDARALKNRLPSDTEQISALLREQEKLVSQIAVQSFRVDERQRFENPRALDSAIIGLRLYPQGRLNPRKQGVTDQRFAIAYDYAELFSNLLRGWRCPVYCEIYFYIAESEEAAMQECAPEEWFTIAPTVFDPEKFKDSSDEEFSKAIFEALATALRRVARTDHLDQVFLEHAIDRIRTEGLGMKMIWTQSENEYHHAKLTYTLPRDRATPPTFVMEVTRKSDGSKASEVIGTFELNDGAVYCFHRLKLGREKLRIVSRNGLRAEIWTKDMPRNKEFELKKLFGHT